MKLKLVKTIFVTILTAVCFTNITSAQTSDCDVTQILRDPKPPVLYSPDSSKYLVNKQDTEGVFQIYVGNKGDTTLTDISSAYTDGNCCGLFRHWSARNKMQVQWHPSGKYIICVVEKEFYQEVLYVPYYPLRLGWLQCGLWMDIWAVTPDGNNWYQLANTINGVTGPAFTPDGNIGVWAEALDTGNIFIDKFGLWRLQRSEFVVNSGVPSFTNTTDINPTGSKWIEPGNFAPDGTSLLISSDIGIANAEGQDQFILDIVTGKVTNLNNTPKVWDEHGVFSPDGKKILFMSSYPYRADTNSYHTLSIKTEFMLMNADGSGLQQLTHLCDTGYLESNSGIAAVGGWTPDGSTIYATSLVFPDYNFWIIKFNGNCGNATSSVNQLTNNGFQFFPNPTANYINITLLSLSSLSVTNLLGQQVYFSRMTNDAGQTQIDISNFHSGIYFLNAQSGNEVSKTKFVVQH